MARYLKEETKEMDDRFEVNPGLLAKNKWADCEYVMLCEVRPKLNSFILACS